MKKYFNKKLIITLSIVFVFVAGAFIYFGNKKRNSIMLDDVLLRMLNDNSVAIYVQNENLEYVQTNNTNFDFESYILNMEKSGCSDKDGEEIKNALSYDLSRGSVGVKTNKATLCYLYFDLQNSDIIITLKNNISTSINHTKELNCNRGSGFYDPKYDRLFVNTGSSRIPVSCNLTFTNNSASGKKTLIDEVTDPNKIVKPIHTYPSVTGVSNEGDAGYRYVGKEPNNWIWFNNEYWRIIGVIPTKINDSGQTQNLVKIMRNDIIGTLSWNVGNTATPWNTTNIYNVLNSYYYGKKNATGELNSSNQQICTSNAATIAADCDYRANGIDPEGYYGKMVKEVYWNTGAVNNSNGYIVWQATDIYAYERNEMLYTGKVGMMNASDFAYASSLLANATARPTINGNYNTLNQSLSNWISPHSYEWTMTRSNSAGYAWNVDMNNTCYHRVVSNGWTVRPVVFLHESVYVVSGDGSVDSPYRVAM